MIESLEYIFVHHFWAGVDGALLFVVGVFLAFPVIRYDLKAVQWLPARIFHGVMRLIGRRPSIARMTAVIWMFNSTAIFIYMSSGIHPLLPKIFGIWTGLNVAIVGATAREESGEYADFGRAGPDQWQPPRALALVCAAAVLVLELPCFWFAIGMGMVLGNLLQAGPDAYLPTLAPRAAAYLQAIVPILLVSALAESIAIRASGRPPEQPD